MSYRRKTYEKRKQRLYDPAKKAEINQNLRAGMEELKKIFFTYIQKEKEKEPSSVVVPFVEPFVKNAIDMCDINNSHKDIIFNNFIKNDINDKNTYINTLFIFLQQAFKEANNYGIELNLMDMDMTLFNLLLYEANKKNKNLKDKEIDEIIQTIEKDIMTFNLTKSESLLNLFNQYSIDSIKGLLILVRNKVLAIKYAITHKIKLQHQEELKKRQQETEKIPDTIPQPQPEPYEIDKTSSFSSPINQDNDFLIPKPLKL